MAQGSTDSDLDVDYHNILESNISSQTGRQCCPLCQSVFLLHHCLRHHHLSSEVHHPGWEEGEGKREGGREEGGREGEREEGERERGRKGGKKGESEEGSKNERGKWNRRGRKDSHT